ncbi:MAG: hypothetical protein VKP62_11890 [Candidatus Sericytochromatia bacterium]|nr:hypothetical protein [Candidatus Sericytochromatia bacterium]
MKPPASVCPSTLAVSSVTKALTRDVVHQGLPARAGRHGTPRRTWRIGLLSVGAWLFLATPLVAEAGKLMNPAVEARLPGITLQLPPGFALASDSEESIPSAIPGGEPAVERFRRYANATGGAIHLFHFQGPPLRDRGPMAYAETWQLQVAGQTVSAGRTSHFFGRPQEVLVAHLQHPATKQARYMLYTTGLDRGTFDRMLQGLKFEPPRALPSP